VAGDIVPSHASLVVALPLDVTERAQIANAIRETEARFDAIDVLVNNAGYGYRDAQHREIDAWEAAANGADYPTT
jgi:NAD(P)-dependent dehydrogenase (short-subunit alcohol dehydrogenase family)